MRAVGFLVGFISPDHPDRAYVHLVATSPNHRRRGLGRMLYERFFDDVSSAWRPPGRRGHLARQPGLGRRSIGRWASAVDDGPGTQRLYGTPAYPDYDADGDDRVVFSREL